MPLPALFVTRDITFLIDMVFAVVAGYLIGRERESRGKDAGVGTQSFVIAGSMIFMYISILMEPDYTLRIAANIIMGVGFLGAGIIMKSEGGHITNLTTAASIWFSTAIGMTIGLGWYFMAVVATAFALFAPKLPHSNPPVEEKKPEHNYHHNWRA